METAEPTFAGWSDAVFPPIHLHAAVCRCVSCVRCECGHRRLGHLDGGAGACCAGGLDHHCSCVAFRAVRA